MEKEYWNTIIILVCLYAVTSISVIIVSPFGPGYLIISVLVSALCWPYLYDETKDYFKRKWNKRELK